MTELKSLLAYVIDVRYTFEAHIEYLCQDSVSTGRIDTFTVGFDIKNGPALGKLVSQCIHLSNRLVLNNFRV